MTNYNNISIRSAASFRDEARFALKGKWKAALLVTLVILLISGSIIGASCTYSTSDEMYPFSELKASIGPLTSISIWNEGELFSDSWQSDGYYPITIPYSPLFVAAAALTALLFLILTPIAQIAQIRLHSNLLYNKTPNFSLLRVTTREYWLFVRTFLLVFWSAFWPLLLAVLIGAAVAAMLPEAEFVLALFAIAGSVASIIRFYRCIAAFYLAVTRPGINAREAVKSSAQLMKGRKWRYVCLTLSFFGWILLYAVFEVALEEILGATPAMPIVSLLCVLARVPLMIYLGVAEIAFLRDAECRSFHPGDDESAPTPNAEPAIEAPEIPAAWFEAAGDSAEPTAAEPQQPAPARQPADTEDDPWSK